MDMRPLNESLDSVYVGSIFGGTPLENKIHQETYLNPDLNLWKKVGNFAAILQQETTQIKGSWELSPLPSLEHSRRLTAEPPTLTCREEAWLDEVEEKIPDKEAKSPSCIEPTHILKLGNPKMWASWKKGPLFVFFFEGDE